MTNHTTLNYKNTSASVASRLSIGLCGLSVLELAAVCPVKRLCRPNPPPSTPPPHPLPPPPSFFSTLRSAAVVLSLTPLHAAPCPVSYCVVTMGTRPGDCSRCACAAPHFLHHQQTGTDSFSSSCSLCWSKSVTAFQQINGFHEKHWRFETFSAFVNDEF